MLEIDLDAPEHSGGQWLAPQKRETAKHPPKNKPSEAPGEETPDPAMNPAKVAGSTAKGFDESKHPRDPGGEGGGQFTSGVGGVSDIPGKAPAAVESIGPKAPKFVKSKNPHNEYGYTVTHAGRSYEVYRDASILGGTWMSHELINASMPWSPGVPADHIGFNKGDVVNEITSGRLAKKIDLIEGHKHAQKIVTAAGGKYNGPQEDGKGGWLALVTETTSGSTGVIPLKDVTPETVAAKLADIKARTKKSEGEDLAKAIAEGLAPTLAAILKGQAQIVEELNADVEQIPVRDATTKRIEKVIRRKVKNVQPIPETKLPKGTGPTVVS